MNLNKFTHLSHLKHLLLLLFLSNCNNSPEITGFLGANKSESTDTHVKYSEADLETLSSNEGGEGITVGNGRDDTAEVKDTTEAFFLACSIAERNKFKCTMSEDFVSEANISKDKVRILDDKGAEIPSENISYMVFESSTEKWLEIRVNSEATAQKIFVNGVDKTVEVTENANDEEVENDEANNSGSELEDCNEIGDPGTWVLVPGDPDYGTQNFCVMKYEAKNNSDTPVSAAAGNPWVYISQQEAIAECSSLGQGFKLISNEQWMTISANIANIGENWTGGSVGAGMIYLGHSDRDPDSACASDADDARSYVENDCSGKNAGGDDQVNQKRTHRLSNGQVIWDLSGNVREWTSFSESVDKPSPQIDGYIEFTEPITGSTSLPLNRLIPTQGVKTFWNDTWNSSQGIGMANIGTGGSGGNLSRGGGFKGVERNGIFRFRMDADASLLVDTLGFRCTYSNP